MTIGFGTAVTYAPFTWGIAEGVEVIGDATPTLGDIDGDGDVDLVIGNTDGTLTTYFRIAFGYEPALVDPFAGVDVGSLSTPSFADLDGDGDLDLVVGSYAGTLTAYENTGYGFAAYTANPFAGLTVGLGAAPTMVDLDNDGDLDLVVGKVDGTLAAYENDGSGFVPYAANPFADIDVDLFARPAFVDLDGDGDLDLVVGTYGGTLRAYENTGSAFLPLASHRLDAIDIGYRSAPTFGDLDGDGDLDLVIGTAGGGVRALALAPNRAPSITSAASATTTENAAGFVYQLTVTDTEGDAVTVTLSGTDAARFALDAATGAVTFKATPDFEAPADADGDNAYQITIIASDAYSTISKDVTITVTDVLDDRFVLAATNPFAAIDVGKGAAPDFADLDADGDLDLVVGADDGTLRVYRKTPDGYELWTTSPLAGINVGTYSVPNFVDLGGDGDPDLILGAGSGGVLVHENTESAFTPVAISTFSAPQVDGFSAPVIIDLDLDGNLEIVLGSIDGTLTTFTYNGFTEWGVVPDSPFAGIRVGYASTPYLTDLDGDGDSDLVLGSGTGRLFAYENTGSAFVAYTRNPFAGIHVGALARPSFADLDGDGDLDLVVGNYDGTLTTFLRVLNEAPSITSGGAGVALEGGVDTTYRGVATDSTGDPITWSLGGADAALLAIDAATGVVTFRSAPDHAAPADADGDNVYEITVIASDGSKADSRAVAITVIDDEPAAQHSFAPVSGIVPAGVTDVFATTFADLDGDGDLDLVLSSFPVRGTTVLTAYQRTGAGFQAFAVDPFAGVAIPYGSAPAFADLDGDGDLDLVVGDFEGKLQAFEKTGTGYVLFAVNPFAGITAERLACPTFVDLDADGDLDLVVGDLYDGAGDTSPSLRAFENDGGVYTAYAVDPFAGITIRDLAAPSFTDLDDDGRLDLVIGTFFGDLVAYKNTEFGWLRFAVDPFEGVLARGMLGFADIDGDGDSDLVGSVAGSAAVYEATSYRPSVTSGNAVSLAANSYRAAYQATGTDPNGDVLTWTLSGTDSALFNIDAATGTVTFKTRPDYLAPSDADGDNAYAVIVTVSDGTLTASRAVTITVTAPEAFVEIIPNPLTGVVTNPNQSPALVDLDRDGDLDLVVGEFLGNISTYRNTGSGFEAYPGNPFGDIFLSGNAKPSFADLDGDGDLDLVVGSYVGTLAAYENGPGGFTPFAASPLAGIDVGYLSAPAFADLDDDGDADLVVGRRDGTLAVYENQGTSFTPAAANPFAGIDVGYNAAPAFADLDGDGDLDLAVGNYDGTLDAYERTGTGFTAFAVNPLAPIEILNYSAPAFGDLDGDGDADLVLGFGLGGRVLVFENTQPMPSRAPQVTSAATESTAENAGGTIYQATATDANGDSITWSLSGADAALFGIDAATGAVTFTLAPDFEAPADDDGDNVYDVTVTATDPGGLADSLDVAIAVTDANDPTTGSVMLRDAGTTLSVDLSSVADEDGIAAIAVQWQSSADNGATWTDIIGATGTSFTPGTGERGTLLRAMADISDAAANVAGIVSTGVAALGRTGGDVLTDGGAERETILWGLGGNDSLSQTDAAADGVTLRGGSGDDRLDASAARASLAGGSGNDTLVAGDGNDSLDGGAGNDVLQAGAGDDLIILRDAGDQIIAAAGDGTDTVRSFIDATLGDGLETLVLVGTALSGSGNAGDNSVTGNTLSNTLSGLAGADSLAGGVGDDVLLGGADDDQLSGGAGRDVFRFLSAAEGTDVITDYVRSADQIEVSAAGFGGGLVAGSRARFTANDSGAATTAAGIGQFIFETDTRTLWWDADGSGGAGAAAIAVFQGSVSLVATEITVIA